MTVRNKKFLEITSLILLFILGLIFRLKGISTNHSFWSDEAFVSSISKSIVLGKTGLIEGINTIVYSRLQILTTVISFRLFGISEWSSRLPSVIWGSIGIIFCYLLAKKHSNKYGGYLAAIIYSILQLNLSQSTQSKPYAAIETLLLINIYFIDTNPLICILSSFSATLYNNIGIILFIPIIIFYINKFSISIKKPIIVLVSISTILLLFFLKIPYMIIGIISPQYNWLTYFRELFWRQYAFITLPGLLGIFTIKNKKVVYGILVSLIVLIYSWCFVSYSHNIRYVVPIFGVLITFFGVFWANVGEIIFKKPALICLSVAILVYAGGYKIVRKPAAYYTPNADFTSDIQNADFKTFFQKSYQLFPDFDNLPVFVGPFDTLKWYTDKNPTALFSINTPKSVYVAIDDSWQYGSLVDFIAQQARYPKGLVVINDWQSFMPDDIKDYVKNNMKLELRVESMAVSPDEKWPLELYSWGFDNKK